MTLRQLFLSWLTFAAPCAPSIHCPACDVHPQGAESRREGPAIGLVTEAGALARWWPRALAGCGAVLNLQSLAAPEHSFIYADFVLFFALLLWKSVISGR